MSVTTKSITSPVFDVTYMALNRTVNKTEDPKSVKGYVVKLRANTNTKEGAEWKKKLDIINPRIVSTQNATKAGEYTFRAFSQFLPLILDNNGNEFEEPPAFFSGATCKASVTITPYTENAKGGSINLNGVTIYELNTDNVDTTTPREAILEAMRAQLK